MGSNNSTILPHMAPPSDPASLTTLLATDHYQDEETHMLEVLEPRPLPCILSVRQSATETDGESFVIRATSEDLWDRKVAAKPAEESEEFE